MNYFITGVSSGIGRALAYEVVKNGNFVWGIARRVELLKTLSKELGRMFYYSVCNVANTEDVEKVMNEINQKNFQPDVIILNAGINPEESSAPLNFEEFKNVINTNLFGAIIWVEKFLPFFLKKGKGHFVAISSLSAYRGDARWPGYSASKSALSCAFESFRAKYTKSGIIFTTVYLGGVDTEMGKKAKTPFKLTPQKVAKKIIHGLNCCKTNITIPSLSRFIYKFLRLVPDRLFSKLTGGEFKNG